MHQAKTLAEVMSNKLFAGVDKPVVNSVYSSRNFIEKKEGDIIFQSGDDSTHLYLVVQGTVKLKFPKVKENQGVVRKSKNDFFGEVELLDGIGRHSSAVAENNTLLFTIEKSKLTFLYSKNKTVESNLFTAKEASPKIEVKTEDQPAVQAEQPPEKNVVPGIPDEQAVIEDEGVALKEEYQPPAEETALPAAEDFPENSITEDEIPREETEADIVPGEENTEDMTFNEEVPEEEYSSETETVPEPAPGIPEETEMPEEEAESVFSKTDVSAHREPFYYLPELSDFLINNLRAQVHSITNTIGAMKKNPSASEEFKKAADIITKQAHLLPILLESVFDFALDARNLTLSPVKLGAALNEVLLIISEYVEVRKVKLYKKFEADADLHIDKQKFFHACFQIARNACDAMPDGGNLFVTLKKENNNMRIEFRDEGPGVPTSIREEIFEPYFSHGKPEGIGLGLTIADKIIKDHGGSVTIEGELGEGTSVVINLPSGS